MAEVEINDAFFTELAHSPEVTALCRAKAEEIAAIARSTAPRDSGDYANNIEVRVVSRASRNVALVVAKDWKSMIIESKTGNLVRALNKVKRG